MAELTGEQSDVLRASQAYCAQVTRERAANFYHGMKLVAEPKRSANYALYAWMRLADDLADEAGELAAREVALRQFYEKTLRVIDPAGGAEAARAAAGGAVAGGDGGDELLWPAVRDMVLRYGLPTEYLEQMIAGQLLDQKQMRYRTFGELYDYCYKVASVVGLSCIEIWGYEGGAATRQLSEWRGIAFQLTNILRDVMEDAERGRIYLPAEDFGVYDLSPTMFTLDRSGDVVRGIGKVAQRAVEYYEKSAPLEAKVHPDGRACLWAMTRIYRGLLDQIVRDPAVVLSRRVSLSKWRKLAIAVEASWRRRIGR
jgi:phytoene synthase